MDKEGNREFIRKEKQEPNKKTMSSRRKWTIKER
jgi:hypothetical protein